MKPTHTHLNMAFRLGRAMEERASVHRRHLACERIHTFPAGRNPENQADRYPDVQEVLLESESLVELSSPFQPRLPSSLMHWLSRMESHDKKGYGSMDPETLMLLHAATAGCMEESTRRGSTWNCIQLGRVTQRAQSITILVMDAIRDHQIPTDPLLQYLLLASHTPSSYQTTDGTLLWRVHRVFAELLKSTLNPKSLESTYLRLGLYLESLPLPECLKRQHEELRMAANRLSNDLSFIDVHEMIGDDPEEHFPNIVRFFHRQHGEIHKLLASIETYLEAFELYYLGLGEEEFFELTL
jgi:uncharacterized alpha-E superfamily protein